MTTEATQRIAMVVEFDGRFYHGWQKQDNAISAQATLETALENLEGHPIHTICAGRTDSGVHAEAMLVH
ncbi:MAG: tRNA pseudouridine(38-40) synthase TruA, partial [Mariprofundaceae bacterium]|nr:tRNA pseudouridine(38-40) synthase TruA [Mariprofundaceae bacterium]